MANDWNENYDFFINLIIVISDFRCPCYVFVGQELRTSKGPTKHPRRQNEMAKTSMWLQTCHREDCWSKSNR